MEAFSLPSDCSLCQVDVKVLLALNPSTLEAEADRTLAFGASMYVVPGQPSQGYTEILFKKAKPNKFFFNCSLLFLMSIFLLILLIAPLAFYSLTECHFS